MSLLTAGKIFRLRARCFTVAVLSVAIVLMSAMNTVVSAKTSGYDETTRLGDETVVFKDTVDPSLRLHLFFPPGHTRDDARPAIVMFFGGGWCHGDPSQFIRWAEHFAARGLVVVLPEYRTRKSHGASPFDAVEDGKDAIRWVRSHARELGIDRNRIAACGGSAGGHIAVSTALLPEVDDLLTQCSESAVPDALILYNPVVDTTSSGYGESSMEGRPEDGSPVHHISPGAPPTVIFHGMADTLVPYENVERFASLMEKDGNVCQLYGYPSGGHGFYRKDVYYADTVAKSDEFLENLGWIDRVPAKQPEVTLIPGRSGGTTAPSPQ
jgi:acetyl esterase/lipase